MSLDLSHLTPEKQAQAFAVLKEMQRRHEQNAFGRFEPYPFQKELYDAGLEYFIRALVAANRIGKTMGAAYEVACHMTGIYPDWWAGVRFDHPVDVWISSLTNETSRDIVQKELIGKPDIREAWGSGMIPGKHLRIKDIGLRQCGIPHVIGTFAVDGIHGISYGGFKVAEQGWEKYQGTEKHFIWQDEEPGDMKIFTESTTRLATTNGKYLYTYTPLKGQTPLWTHIQGLADKGEAKIVNAGWDDAPHLTEEMKASLIATYPSHEIEARTKGIPMLGQGAVFPIRDEEIMCEPFEIQPHFWRICGIDFGYDHPAAAVWIAHNRDTDIIYVYNCYKKAKELTPYHASAIRRGGDWIPVAWPHDGMKTDKNSGKQLRDGYKDEGVNMLPFSARYEDDKGGSQAVEPIVMEVHQRMRDGRLQVFSNLKPFFDEKNSYHRDEKTMKIVDRNDDIMKAMFYAVMMVRYARPQNLPTPRSSADEPMYSM